MNRVCRSPVHGEVQIRGGDQLRWAIPVVGWRVFRRQRMLHKEGVEPNYGVDHHRRFKAQTIPPTYHRGSTALDLLRWAIPATQTTTPPADAANCSQESGGVPWLPYKASQTVGGRIDDVLILRSVSRVGVLCGGYCRSPKGLGFVRYVVSMMYVMILCIPWCICDDYVVYILFVRIK